MKIKSVFPLSLALLHFSAVLASADTFFFLAPSGEQNVNDMGLWKRLSTYDSSGDNWEFYVFPEGTDDRITLDKGNHAGGRDRRRPVAGHNVGFRRYP